MRQSEAYPIPMEHSRSGSCSCAISSMIPAQLIEAFSKTSCLLPGEKLADYEAIRQMMIDDIQPQNNLEWLWLLDLTELSWEILRYRQLKQRIIEAYRELAIEAILLRLDGLGCSRENFRVLQSHIRRNVADWRDNPAASAEIEARLLQHNFDGEAISAEAYCQAREAFAFFDDLVRSAQNRRIALLREINYRREFAKHIARRTKASIKAGDTRNRGRQI